MKSFITAALIALASTSAFAELKKEVWNCQAPGMELKATFTKTGYTATMSNTSHYDDEVAELSLQKAGQVNALTGSQRTILRGGVTSWDSYDYKITLVRNRMDDFYAGGSNNDKVEGSAMVHIDAEIDCYGQRVDVVAMTCEVEIIRK